MFTPHYIRCSTHGLGGGRLLDGPPDGHNGALAQAGAGNCQPPAREINNRLDQRQAQANAYALVQGVSFAGMQYRKDIGYRALD